MLLARNVRANEGNVNIAELETFAWIVRLGSFVAAAERLSASESALSRSIDGLERDMGVRLFEPSRDGARLTCKGRELVPYAERVIELTTDIRSRIATPAILTGVARVGTGELIAMSWITKLAQAAKERYPQLVLEITLGSPGELTGKVRDGELDLALVPGPVTEPRLASRSLGEAEFRWMASPKLDVPEGDMTPGRVATLPIIACSQQSQRYRSVEQWFCAADVGYRVFTDCNSLRAVIALTVAGQGLSPLPLVACEEYVQNGSLRILKTRPAMPRVEFFAVSAQIGLHSAADALTALAVQASTFAPARAPSKRPKLLHPNISFVTPLGER